MESGTSVFVVEDSALIRERIIRDIASLGKCRVIGVAESESDAVVAIQRLRPAVVVTDLQLKQGSGIEVVRKVRMHSPEPPPVIIVLTNYATAEYRHACLESGADEFLDKTSEYARFLSLMEDACQRLSRAASNGSTAS